MILLPPQVASLVTHAAFVAVITSSLASVQVPPHDIPIIEIIKVYGRLAGPECYGLKAPPGSSCQMQQEEFEKLFHLENQASRLSREEFTSKLEKLDFQWPLKPYGIDKSLAKTAVVNKGAETRVFMDEIESRGLYDRRNPTGPLPTSLRPALNKKLQQEGLDARAVDLVYSAFIAGSGDNKDLTAEQVPKIFRSGEQLDYYEFLQIIGTDAITWPN